MDLHVAPEELSRAISLADECARTLAPIDIEPGTAGGGGSRGAVRHAVGFGGDARVVIIERGRSGGDPRAHVFVFGLAVVGERPDLLVQDLRIGSGLHERFVLGG